ncbi:ERF family protein [Acidithiobacillus sp. HP-6]|uniref:ERF family protein n=1 Tax=unclassified Acidithiobacillus TaxID=2614800 RepID=UPI0018799FC4|nr:MULTISPECIES: ERF family protein [unclassified Acidithiobacillus]MBE7562693.1 ERF family protein [Acidithiobacillus sp. HP-6]MBE7570511.1 ERF family protein [Acidithiobacillus sp. HP-2]
MENQNQKLFGALLQAQKAFSAVRKDGKNPMYKSQYATLDSVLDAVRQPLLDAGILLMQPPVDTGERLEKPCATVRTTLIHAESGESLEVVTSIPLAKNDAQGYGSAVTYARRYALMGLLGIAPEDDDGNAASSSAGNAGRQQVQRPRQQQNQQAAATSSEKKEAAKAGPSLESALEKVKKSPVEKLDFAEQWCRMNFTGDDLKALEKAIAERRSAAA